MYERQNGYVRRLGWDLSVMNTVVFNVAAIPHQNHKEKQFQANYLQLSCVATLNIYKHVNVRLHVYINKYCANPLYLPCNSNNTRSLDACTTSKVINVLWIKRAGFMMCDAKTCLISSPSDALSRQCCSPADDTWSWTMHSIFTGHLEECDCFQKVQWKFITVLSCC